MNLFRFFRFNIMWYFLFFFGCKNIGEMNFLVLWIYFLIIFFCRSFFSSVFNVIFLCFLSFGCLGWEFCMGIEMNLIIYFCIIFKINLLDVIFFYFFRWNFSLLVCINCLLICVFLYCELNWLIDCCRLLGMIFIWILLIGFFFGFLFIVEVDIVVGFCVVDFCICFFVC